MESTSASSLSRLRQHVRQLVPYDSSPIIAFDSLESNDADGFYSRGIFKNSHKFQKWPSLCMGRAIS
jgi:hypothetical protein